MTRGWRSIVLGHITSDAAVSLIIVNRTSGVVLIGCISIGCISVNVEMEIVLPADMTVRESHDIALALQHKIELLPEVERAFVHVHRLQTIFSHPN